MSAESGITIPLNSHKLMALALRANASVAFFQQLADLPQHNHNIYLTRQQAEDILDALGDTLCAKGITNGEINAYGLWIEPMIDIVNEQLHP